VVPEIVGSAVFAGGTAATVPLRVERASVEPAAFVAVTTARSCEATSSDTAL
jgi:predicted naringenin-chalcone synthase